MLLTIIIIIIIVVGGGGNCCYCWTTDDEPFGKELLLGVHSISIINAQNMCKSTSFGEKFFTRALKMDGKP